MATVVNLHVRNLDITNDDNIDALALLENVWPGSEGNNVTLSVFVDDGESVVRTVMAAAESVSKIIRGVYAYSVDPDLVSTSDIAARTGFTREAIRQWSVKGDNEFPIEVSTISNGQKVWRWVEIVEWLCIHKNLNMDEELPTPAEVNRIDERLLAQRNRSEISTGWNQVSTSLSGIEVSVSAPSVSMQPLDFGASTRGSHYREEAACVG